MQALGAQGGSFCRANATQHLSSSSSVLVAPPCRRFRQHPEHSNSNKSNSSGFGGHSRRRQIQRCASDQPEQQEDRKSSTGLGPQASLRTPPGDQDYLTTFSFTGPTPALNNPSSSTAQSPTNPPPSPLPHYHSPTHQPPLSQPSIPSPLHCKVEESSPPPASTSASMPASSSPFPNAATTPPPPPEPSHPSQNTPSSTHPPGSMPEHPHQRDQPQEVDAAMARAQDTLSQLESSLDAIPLLHSANISSSELPMPPMNSSSPWTRALAIARNVVLIGGGGVALIASHAFGLAVQLLSAVAGAVGIAYLGHRRGSLSASGAVVAFMVGVGTLCCSMRFAATLLAFFFASSKLTHFKEDIKGKMDDNAKLGGRDWKQVLCNGLVPTCVAVAYGLVAGCVDVPLGPSAQLELWRAKVLTLLGGAYLGWYACCCGDTWASEVGPLSRATPRLITTMRPVRRGTNGGVTMLGLAASVAGGTFTGLVFYLAGLVSPTLWIFEAQRATAAAQWQLIPLGTLAGLVGSLVDSLLGATVQFSGFNHETNRVTSKPGPKVTRITGMSVLDNNFVNVVSAAITAALTACAAFWLFSV